MKLTTKKLYQLIQEQLLLENQLASGLMSDNPRLVMKYLDVLESQGKITHRIDKAYFGSKEQTEVRVKFLDDELFEYVKRLYNKMNHDDINMNIDYVLMGNKKLNMLWLG